MAKSIVIVESPAKANTINKYLGDGYKVVASQGHLVDLPKSSMGVDVEDKFKPNFIVIPSRKKILTQLKKEMKEGQNLYLATDPDREGEAISFHIAQKIGSGKNVYRVIFNEITKRAIEEAFKNPKEIDQNKVMAQQARRVLDRIVGYSLSPLLWKKVSMGLSAGRVQSIAVRLIVEREDEVKVFVPEEYWELQAELLTSKEENFVAKLEKHKGKKIKVKSQTEADKLLDILNKASYIVDSIKKTKRNRSPQPPFTTSKLQQDAFNKLGFSASRTMRIAQQLYEGIELDEEGPTGLITYMRTDSVRISVDAQKEAKEFILEKFGKDFYPETPNKYKAKKNAQEAHEAIRPTSILKEPVKLEKFLNEEQRKLYELIWNRFVASQMSKAVYNVTSVDIKADDYIFRASGTQEIFAGFNIVYESEKKENGSVLPELHENEELSLIKLNPSQHFTKPPARYTEASLVKALEEMGIGRPSTYAPTLHTIIVRHYIKRLGSSLAPTELGVIVTRLLLKHFPKILDYEFTKKLEDELDDIELGKLDYFSILDDFYGDFTTKLTEAQNRMREVKKEQIPTDKKCQLCGAVMVVKWGRRGKFLSCSKFPKCRGSESISTGVKCPKEDCEGELIERRTKRGRTFYGCTNYPKCDYIGNKLPQEETE